MSTLHIEAGAAVTFAECFPAHSVGLLHQWW